MAFIVKLFLMFKAVLNIKKLWHTIDHWMLHTILIQQMPIWEPTESFKGTVTWGELLSPDNCAKLAKTYFVTDDDTPKEFFQKPENLYSFWRPAGSITESLRRRWGLDVTLLDPIDQKNLGYVVKPVGAMDGGVKDDESDNDDDEVGTHVSNEWVMGWFKFSAADGNGNIHNNNYWHGSMDFLSHF